MGSNLLINKRAIVRLFAIIIVFASVIFLTVYILSDYQSTEPFKSELENENGNLHIYVLNNFFPKVNIDVFLEEEKIISKTFLFEGSYVYKKLTFKVEPGVYSFKVFSSDLNLEKNEVIDIDKTQWILVKPVKNRKDDPEILIFKQATPLLFM